MLNVLQEGERTYLHSNCLKYRGLTPNLKIESQNGTVVGELNLDVEDSGSNPHSAMKLSD